MIVFFVLYMRCEKIHFSLAQKNKTDSSFFSRELYESFSDFQILLLMDIARKSYVHNVLSFAYLFSPDFFYSER